MKIYIPVNKYKLISKWLIAGFKTGLERGLICNQCIGTHPGCSIFNYNW